MEKWRYTVCLYKINAMARGLILTEDLQAVLKTHQLTNIFLVFFPDVFELHMALPEHYHDETFFYFITVMFT